MSNLRVETCPLSGGLKIEVGIFSPTCGSKGFVLVGPGFGCGWIGIAPLAYELSQLGWKAIAISFPAGETQTTRMRDFNRFMTMLTSSAS